MPEPILAAKRVFVANAGVDNESLVVFSRFGDVNAPYARFYSTLKKWGRFDLVNAPAGSDLVLEVHFTAPLTDAGRLPTYAPALQVKLIDTKTHFILWALAAPVEGAFRKATFEKNIDEAIGQVIGSLKDLVSSAGPDSPQHVGK